MRLPALAFLLLLAAAGSCGAVAGVSYDVYFHGNGSVEIDANIHLDWAFTEYAWWLPPGTEVVGVYDARGPLEYWVDGGKVKFYSTSTENGQEIRARFSRANASDCYGPVCHAGLSLSGFSGEETQVRMHFEHSKLFASEPAADNGLITKAGGVYLRANYVADDEKGYALGEFPHYAVYAPQGEDYSQFFRQAERYYWLVGNLTGLTPVCSRFIVASVPDEMLANFAGDYSGACLIRLKHSFMNSSWYGLPNFMQTVLHETTHGFMGTLPVQNSSWFKEGVSNFVAFRAYDLEEGMTPETAYVVKQKTFNGTTYPFVSVAKRIPLNELDDFYLDGGKWTPEWTPYDQQTTAERDFGYSYSHFIINAFARRFGDDKLPVVVAELSRSGEASTAPEETGLILNAMRSATGKKLLDDELLYPYRQTLLSQGKNAFKAEVGNLSIDQDEINKTQTEVFAAYYRREIPPIGPHEYNVTETGSPDYEPNSTDFVLLGIVVVVAVIMPLLFLALLAYLAYRLFRKLTGKGQAKPAAKIPPVTPQKPQAKPPRKPKR
ncbi:hypothetical protein COX86_03785 [Candidatus Micrarchaeota archaeon CG_4_10_14_0_2_um_filter_60_11]|nr:MAG: hypothetical protein COX86_03785 [Candidatus Micrarchaeota archaeon CG_4_10_14_0_2_um_filter_60_11]